MGFRKNIRSRLEDGARPLSDQERKQVNSRNSLAGSMGGTNSFYEPKGDDPGSYVKTGYRYATTQSPGGRGSNRKQIDVYTWQPDSSAAAQAAAEAGRNSNPTPLDIDPRRGTGEYDDIVDSLKSELGTAQRTIADIQNRQVEQINTPSVQDQLAAVLAQMQIDFESRYSGLQDMMLQQSQQFQSSMQMMMQQSQAAQAAYQEQLRLSQNMAKAYVPAAEKTAETAAIGDQREIPTRDVKNNSLSELSILSGLGTSSNPLSGLQLA